MDIFVFIFSFLFFILFYFFWRRIPFRKYVKFALRENKKSLAPKYFGAFDKKNFSLFDKFLMDLEYFHQMMLSFKGMRFCSMFGSNHKNEFGKPIERRPYLSQFE